MELKPFSLITLKTVSPFRVLPTISYAGKRQHHTTLVLIFPCLSLRINLSVDYYYRKGTDLIGVKNLPLENGFNGMTINWASMENKGIEVNLQTRNITTRNFSWYTTFNFAYNYNKVLKDLASTQSLTPGLEGNPAGTIFAIRSKVDPETGRILIYPKGSNEAVSVEEYFEMYDESGGLGLYQYNGKATSNEICMSMPAQQTHLIPAVSSTR